MTTLNKDKAYFLLELSREIREIERIVKKVKKKSNRLPPDLYKTVNDGADYLVENTKYVAKQVRRLHFKDGNEEANNFLRNSLANVKETRIELSEMLETI
ncbi:hypothetical protein M3152_08335 [Sporosarcina luteola]|uniref:hypothetical protein n=1 Tax=Sporosarcina luteola TaxID=582850 RepID=UPI0020425D66|nr:hypothetical protein [Sporosarcina luteola]MCM3637728.1 hypothetical protein [Sporosarcina luteola]